MAYIVTVKLLLDVDSEAAAADAINEILREEQRDFAPESCLIDYQHGESMDAGRSIPEDYEEGEFCRW